MPIAVVRRQTDAEETHQIAQKEEVRGHSGIHSRRLRVVGLRQDVCERQEGGQPEHDAHRGRPDVLPQAMSLEAEITHADRCQGEGNVEDRNGIGDREAVRVEQGRENQDGKVGERHQPKEKKQGRKILAQGSR